jgi:hypothetical protein
VGCLEWFQGRWGDLLSFCGLREGYINGGRFVQWGGRNRWLVVDSEAAIVDKLRVPLRERFRENLGEEMMRMIIGPIGKAGLTTYLMKSLHHSLDLLLAVKLFDWLRGEFCPQDFFLIPEAVDENLRGDWQLFIHGSIV